MIDPIERQAAIDAAIEAVDEWDGGTNIERQRRIEKAIKALPSADQEEFEWCHDCKEYDQERHCCHRFTKTIRDTVEEIKARGEWIPCSERLPEIKECFVSDPCLVYCSNGAYGITELKQNIFGSVWFECEKEDEYHEVLGEVVAWLPLPEPYKGEV